MHPAHQNGQFVVPRREDSPDVGVVATPYTEPLADEIAEAASNYLSASDHLSPGVIAQREANILAGLILFGREVVRIIERRAAADIEDFSRPVLKVEKAELSQEQKRKVVAAELGRILDWICKGRPVLDMGVRAAVVATHIRAKAIDHRTDQQIAREVGNASRESVNKVRKEFRRSLGADYPGEHGKGSNTKKRCKKSRLKNLKN